jgi:hypothetical protein
MLSQPLQRVAGLFSGHFCSGEIAGKALGISQVNLSSALVELRSELGCGYSGLEKTNGFSVIPFKSQLKRLDEEGALEWSVRGYI